MCTHKPRTSPPEHPHIQKNTRLHSSTCSPVPMSLSAFIRKNPLKQTSSSPTRILLALLSLQDSRAGAAMEREVGSARRCRQCKPGSALEHALGSAGQCLLAQKVCGQALVLSGAEGASGWVTHRGRAVGLLRLWCGAAVWASGPCARTRRQNKRLETSEDAEARAFAQARAGIRARSHPQDQGQRPGTESAPAIECTQYGARHLTQGPTSRQALLEEWLLSSIQQPQSSDQQPQSSVQLPQKDSVKQPPSSVQRLWNSVQGKSLAEPTAGPLHTYFSRLLLRSAGLEAWLIMSTAGIKYRCSSSCTVTGCAQYICMHVRARASICVWICVYHACVCVHWCVCVCVWTRARMRGPHARGVLFGQVSLSLAPYSRSPCLWMRTTQAPPAWAQAC